MDFKEKVASLQNTVQTLTAIANDVEQGVSVIKACEERGVLTSKFRTFMKTDFFSHNSKTDLELTDFCTWQDMFVQTITGDKDSRALPDFDDALELTLQTLTEREADIVMRRLRDFDTLEMIAEDYHLSRDRIRQIEGKALRKLRHPSRCCAFILGVFGKRVADLERQKEALHKEQQRLITRLNEANAKLEASVKELREAVASAEEQVPREETILICDMDISNHSKNALRRHGCKTLNDIRDLTRDDFYHIRGIGWRTYEEIANVLKRDYGITIQYC